MTREAEIEVFFPPLTNEQRAVWASGKLRGFLTGTIRYRDAFGGTPVHRKYFGVTCNIGSSWTLNKLVRNDEEDEDQGDAAVYHEN